MKTKLSKPEKILKEKISENKKRGRPRRFDEKYEEFLRQVHGKYVPLRTVQNRDYAQRAIEVLDFCKEEDSPYRWVFDPDKSGIAGVSERRGFRKTILTELGREKNDDGLRAMAKKICELKPKTKEAVALIRRWRLRGNVKVRVSLEEAIEKAIADYKSLHPEISDSEVYIALSNLETKYEEISINSIFNRPR